jgi:hypothetical protein
MVICFVVSGCMVRENVLVMWLSETDQRDPLLPGALGQELRTVKHC